MSLFVFLQSAEQASVRSHDDERVALLEGVADLLLVFFADPVFEAVFLGFTVEASFFAPTEEDLFADVDRRVVAALFEAVVVFFALVDAELVDFFEPLDVVFLEVVDPAVFLDTDADRDLVVLRPTGDVETVFLLDVLAALLLRPSPVVVSTTTGSSTGIEVSSDFFPPFDDLHVHTVSHTHKYQNTIKSNHH